MLIYVSTSYSSNCTVKIEICVNSANNTLGTWSTLYESQPISGWSGWNSFYINRVFGSNKN
jgi:hypothetical protein